MNIVARILTGIGCAVALAAAAGATAQEKQVYRYTDKDGNVVYTDRAPPSDSKDVQAKRLGPNYIETNELPLAARQAMDRYPVTLYTFACGELCQNAERLKALTGDTQAPVLQVGDKLYVKGYNEARWQAMLDDAGYPKTPATRRAQPLRPPAAPAAPAAAPKDAPMGAVTPTPGGGYPKQ